MKRIVAVFFPRSFRMAIASAGKSVAEYAAPVALFGVAVILLAPRIDIDTNHGKNAPLAARDDLSRAQSTTTVQDRPGIRHQHPMQYEMIAVGVAVVALGLWFVQWNCRKLQLNRGRRRRDRLELGPGACDDPSRNRLAEKRLKILGTLVNDNHKLLPSDLTVGDLMTTVVRTALPSTPVDELRAMTSEYKIRHILVCNECSELIGVVSDRDLRRVVGNAVASDLMAECPTTVSSTSLVNSAITLLLYGHISSLPVVDDGRLVGILTTTDVVMTLQCTMLAVEQMVRDLGAGHRATISSYAAS